MAQSKSSKAREPRYPATSLDTEEESAEYWLKGYNHSVFKVLSRIDENVIDIKADVAELKADVTGIKTDVAGIKDGLKELTELVKDGFSALGINISNGDHRVGGRAIRPVK